MLSGATAASGNVTYTSEGYCPKNWRYSIERIDVITISAWTKLPLNWFSLFNQNSATLEVGVLADRPDFSCPNMIGPRITDAAGTRRYTPTASLLRGRGVERQGD